MYVAEELVIDIKANEILVEGLKINQEIVDLVSCHC